MATKNFDLLAHIVGLCLRGSGWGIMIMVNVLKFRTLKNNYFFSAVRNFRNYVSEKVLVFMILECGL